MVLITMLITPLTPHHSDIHANMLRGVLMPDTINRPRPLANQARCRRWVAQAPLTRMQQLELRRRRIPAVVGRQVVITVNLEAPVLQGNMSSFTSTIRQGITHTSSAWAEPLPLIRFMAVMEAAAESGLKQPFDVNV